MSTLSWDQIMPANWQAVRTAPASGAFNMAVDAALLESAHTRDHGVWRTYAWETPTISFGRNEAVRTRFDADSVAASGLDAVRRPTGGRALLHAAEVTYSVTMPLADRVPWSAAYEAINHVLLAAIRSLGVAAELVPDATGAVHRPDGPVCFEHPSPGEIAVGGAKLAGSAVWRERGAYLQHGSILLRDDQARLLEAMRVAHPLPPSAASLDRLLDAVPRWEQIATALEAVLERTVQASVTGSIVGSLSAAPLELDAGVVARHERQFRDPAWLWRR